MGRILRFRPLVAVLAGSVLFAAAQISPSATPSDTASSTPWLWNVNYDSANNSFVGIQTRLTWHAAATACVNLGVGWSLATIYDSVSGASITGGGKDCMGSLPSGLNYWIGLWDPTCCLDRPVSRMNRTFDGWKWASGWSTEYFHNQSAIYWGPSQPDNSAGAQGCVYQWNTGPHLLDDLSCTGSMASCCMRFPASSTPSPSVTSTSSLTQGVSASVTAFVSQTATSSSSPSTSTYAEQDAPVSPVDAGALVGGIIAVIAVGATVGTCVTVVVPAYALWRRQKAKRGGALKSRARIQNSINAQESFRTTITPTGGDETLNPAAAVVSLQMVSPHSRTTSAPRLAVGGDTPRRPSAKAMGLGV